VGGEFVLVKAGYVAFEMLSEWRIGTEQSYGIETRIN
jgi:hypothetical protein